MKKYFISIDFNTTNQCTYLIKNILFSTLFTISSTLLYCQAGALDGSFRTGYGTNYAPFAHNYPIKNLHLLSDNKLLISGGLITYDSIQVHFIARLNQDGSLDTTFNRNDMKPSEHITVSKVMSNGKILIGGEFKYIGERVMHKMARLHPNGDLDTTFNPQMNILHYVSKFDVYSSQNILVADAENLFKLKADGAIDNSFSKVKIQYVEDLKILKNNKILVSADFINVGTVTKKYFVQLKSDGSIDQTFLMGSGFNGLVTSFHVQHDNKILCSGYFSKYNGQNVSNLVRLNENGTIDTTFNAGLGTNRPITSIKETGTGHIILGGEFKTYNGSKINTIARINYDGSIDKSFQTLTGATTNGNFGKASGSINDILIDQNKRIIIGGYFHEYGNVVQNSIARLLTQCNIIQDTLDVSACSSYNYLDKEYFRDTVFTNYFKSIYLCDSIVTIDLHIKNKISSEKTIQICEGETYEGHISSGIYTNTFTASYGCDSIRTLHLIVKPKFELSETIQICEGETYEGHSSSGIYTNTFTASNGCDSIRTLHLIVKPKFELSETIQICEGETYEGHSSSGIYTNTFTASNGCDSIRTLHLIVKPKFESSETIQICEGETYEGHNTSGIYTNTITVSNGCDSLRTLILIVKSKFESSETIQICEGETYEGHNTSGIYTNTFTASNGCDSVRTLILIEKPKFESSETIQICEGEIYEGHSSSGIYTNTITASNGCDSVRTVHLLVLPVLDPSCISSVHNLNENSKLLTVVPNPFTSEEIQLVSTLKETKFEIVDISGHILSKGQFTGDRYSVNSSLPSGVYIIVYSDADGKSRYLKAVKL